MNQAGGPKAKAKVLTQYADCFKGIGCFKEEYHITLDPKFPQVIHPPHRLPEAQKEPF